MLVETFLGCCCTISYFCLRAASAQFLYSQFNKLIRKELRIKKSFLDVIDGVHKSHRSQFLSGPNRVLFLVPNPQLSPSPPLKLTVNKMIHVATRRPRAVVVVVVVVVASVAQFRWRLPGHRSEYQSAQAVRSSE